MTDARLPEKWLTDRRLARLDDASFRSFAQALMWSVSNRTDGLIEPDDLALIPTFVRGSVPALVASGLWTALGHGWLITDFVSTQTSRSELEVLENARRRERHKKQRQRARAVEKPSGECDVPRDGPGDVPRDHTGRTGQARTGRTGKDSGGNPQRSGSPLLDCGVSTVRGWDRAVAESVSAVRRSEG